MDKKNIKVLLIENNAEDAGLVEEMLRSSSTVEFQLERVESLTQGFRQMLAWDFDVLILDLGLADSAGVETFRKVHSIFPNIPTVVLTGLTDDLVGDITIREGAEDYLIKGEVSRNALIRSVRNAIERKEVVRRQEEKERLLWSVFNDSPTLISVQDSENKAVLVNRAMASIYGLSPQAMIGRVIRDGLDFKLLAERENNPCEGAQPSENSPRLVLQESFTCAGGSTRYFQTVKVPLSLRNKGEGVLCLATDITESVKIKDVLLEHQERFDNLLKTIHDAMSMVDQDHNVIWANAIACRMFGENMVGRKCYEVFHKKDQPCEKGTCATLKALQTGEVHEQEIQTVSAEGRVSNFHCVANVVHSNRNAKERTVINVFRDITQHKKVQADMEEKKRALSVMSRNLAIQEERQKEMLAHLQAAKDELKRIREERTGNNPGNELGQISADVLHEIKNYLGIIILALSGLGDQTGAVERDADSVAMIRDAALRAQGVIAPLLNFARSTRAVMAEEDLHALIVSAIGLVKHSAQVKHIAIETRFQGEKILVPAEATLLRQVFLNLLSNAIDAIESEGAIVVKTSLPADSASRENKFVSVEISDTGAGIPKWAIDKVFEPFFTTKMNKGTGLGLNLVKMIVEKHGGKVAVVSSEGQGTTFTLTLPLKAGLVDSERPDTIR